ncbi:CLUMA_CG008241, isoform A [Clunio marinus]|uniref:CLUMA_CG008241, isoform A n=1 Tax=Clunio marinus TaxID=568069 RepID=A0A1J1I367_9DIPT|nr:CLUMA_CG008241, isoform A [Clunio marinus]
MRFEVSDTKKERNENETCGIKYSTCDRMKTIIMPLLILSKKGVEGNGDFKIRQKALRGVYTFEYSQPSHKTERRFLSGHQKLSAKHFLLTLPHPHLCVVLFKQKFGKSDAFLFAYVMFKTRLLYLRPDQKPKNDEPFVM